MKKLTRVCKICLFAFSANLLLFGVKLYVGLAANSITVFSDAVNNLFDALSGGVSFAGLFAISRMADPSAAFRSEREMPTEAQGRVGIFPRFNSSSEIVPIIE